jgi:nucleoside-diphosphate-sugar epimerase
MKWQRFLVTGAGGFVGACLTRRLIELGADVSVLLRPTTDLWRLQGVMDKVRRFEADLLDRASVGRAVSEAGAQVVYHLAAHGGYSTQSDATRILEVNVLGTLNVLEACAASPCQAFVAAGSSSEYGFSDEPMRETDRLQPNSFYAVGKAAASHLGHYFATLVPFSIATLRLFSVYGPYEEPTRLVPTLLRRAAAHEPLDMVAPETARDFVYVEDVVDAFLRLEELSTLHGDAINVGAGTQVTIREVVEVVTRLTGSRSEVRWNAMPRRIWDAPHWVASIEKARTVLGWRPRHSFAEGVAKTLEWTRRSREEVTDGVAP